jgi:glutamyl-tRNA(Gln) amidotransferase subunit E
MELDYRALGLMVGLEIHQELDTHKLFCRCPSALTDEGPELQVIRRLRPTQSELGEVDRAALAEAIKGKSFRYQAYSEFTCLVELDEEPPNPVNEEAIDIALEIALLLNAKPVDEAHAMRKIVIDGSNTCGFQRTILIATDGLVETDQIRARIPTICLEEDAARKVGENAGVIDYRLDRLGVPLVEIATAPDFYDPYTPAKAARYIGQLMRATGKVKRGIGTIRQDINVSIKEGARQEIKGIQELSLIPKVIEREVQRQIKLLEISRELIKRGAKEVKEGFVDVSHIFLNTSSSIIRNALSKGGAALAVKLPKFGGLLKLEIQPGRRFGTELADHAKVYGGVGGVFHTDELPAYGISSSEVENIRRVLSSTPEDAVVIVADEKVKAEAALKAVVKRASQAIFGVPEETRRALPDGNTEFTRPLPGAGRMYVETDIPAIVITEERLEKIRKKLPERPEQKLKRFIGEYGLSKEMAERVAFSENVDLFEEVVRKYKSDPTLVASTLTETLVSLRRDGVDVEKISDEKIVKLFELISEGKIAKEAIPEILRVAAKGVDIPEAIKQLGLEAISKEELLRLIRETIQINRELVLSRGDAAIGPLMGKIMDRVRGKVDGKIVHETIELELRRFLKEQG